MKFLAVVMSYIISQSLSGHGEPVTGWANRWFQFLQQCGLGIKLVVLVYALLPVLLFSALLYWVDSVILSFVISIPVLLLAFKSGDQPERLAEYKAKRESGEDEAAWHIAVSELGLERQLYEPNDELLDDGVQAGLAYLYLERFFVSIFWFIAFGAPGVLLVWLIATLIRAEQVDAFLYRVKHALFWMPVRLMAFTLALMGNFTHCFPVWLEQAKQFEKDDRVLLINCLNTAVGRVNEDTMLEESLALIKRCEWAWLVGLALMLIFG
ncbi:MAG: regulatory signaling modulator protein AmpE [Reinekea sp.]